MDPLKDNYLNLEKHPLFRYHCSRSLTGGQGANIPSTVGYLSDAALPMLPVLLHTAHTELHWLREFSS